MQLARGLLLKLFIVLGIDAINLHKCFGTDKSGRGEHERWTVREHSTAKSIAIYGQ